MISQKEDKSLKDQLGELDPPYESANELKIGRLLDNYGIPFFYKQPMIIYNQGHNEIWKPSFTLPHQGWVVIDYIDDPRKSVLEERLNVYNYNQVPATVLGPPDLDKPNFQQHIYEKLEDAVKKLNDPTAYDLSQLKLQYK